jgi:hypothetical protein
VTAVPRPPGGGLRESPSRGAFRRTSTVAFVSGFAQGDLGKKPVPRPAVVAAMPEAFPENLTGEVVSAEKGPGDRVRVGYVEARRQGNHQDSS